MGKKSRFDVGIVTIINNHKQNNEGAAKPLVMPKSDPRRVIAGTNKTTCRGVLRVKR